MERVMESRSNRKKTLKKLTIPPTKINLVIFFKRKVKIFKNKKNKKEFFFNLEQRKQWKTAIWKTDKSMKREAVVSIWENVWRK